MSTHPFDRVWKTIEDVLGMKLTCSRSSVGRGTMSILSSKEKSNVWAHVLEMDDLPGRIEVGIFRGPEQVPGGRAPSKDEIKKVWFKYAEEEHSPGELRRMTAAAWMEARISR